MLGAGRVRTFREVTFPALRPAIAAAGAVVFLFTFTSFGVILILGGPGTATLETEIYRQTAQFLNLPLAAALTVVQLVAIVLLLVLTSWIEGRQRVTVSLRCRERDRAPCAHRGRARLPRRQPRSDGAAPRRADRGAGRALASTHRAGSDSTSTGLSARSTPAARSSWSRWTRSPTRCGSRSRPPRSRSSSAGVQRSRSRPSRRRALDTVVSLPLGVSAVTVGFGFLITLDHRPIDLRGSWWLVPIAQALVAVPFVVRVMTPVLRAIDPRLRDAAATLGASPARVWREVDLPIVARAALVAAGFAFAISLGEFGATVFIVRPDQPTLPVLVYRLLGQPGPLNFGGAMAASVILMALTALAILGIERFRVGTVGSF